DIYFKCPFKNKSITTINHNQLVSKINNNNCLIFNTNLIIYDSDAFYNELINKFNKLVPSNYDICYLYKDDFYHNSIFIKGKSNNNNIYYLNIKTAYYCNKAIFINGIGDFILADY